MPGAEKTDEKWSDDARAWGNTNGVKSPVAYANYVRVTGHITNKGTLEVMSAWKLPSRQYKTICEAADFRRRELNDNTSTSCGSAVSKDQDAEVADNTCKQSDSTNEKEAINKTAGGGTVRSNIQSGTSSKRNNGKETATKALDQDKLLSGTKRAKTSCNSLPLTQQVPKKQKTETASAPAPKPASKSNVKVVPYELLLRMRRTIIDGTDDKKSARDTTR